MWQMYTARNSPIGRSGVLRVVNKGTEELVYRNSTKYPPLGNSKDRIAGNGTYSSEGPIHQVTTKIKKPSSAPGSKFGPGIGEYRLINWRTTTITKKQQQQQNNNNNNNNNTNDNNE